MLSFKEKVILVVSKIPYGKVVSYGQVAAASGHPRAPRQVGQILKTLDIRYLEIPWWRVINNQGIITIKGNWTNSGTYSPTAAGTSVTFSGTAQSISGATTFNGMTINVGFKHD